MADVRLTATNPEDSSVVPVACDASGRLLLEEQGQGPPGPEGPPGPKGDDGKDGDSFSGNFADDVTFGGDATFAGLVQTGGNPDSGAEEGARMNGGSGFSAAYSSSSSLLWKGYEIGNDQPTSSISVSGSATFADDVTVGPYDSQPYTKGIRFLVSNNEVSAIVINGDGENKTAIGIYDGSNRKYICKLFHDGHVAFSGNKAGFTAEGYLWCTTRRGDTVILDATSNGLASWVEYTPPSRKQQIEDRLDSIREEKPDTPTYTQ